MDRKEFISHVSKELNRFLEFVESIIMEAHASAKTPIQKKLIEKKIMDTKSSSIDKLEEIFKDIVEVGYQEGIKKEDPEVDEIISLFKKAALEINNLNPEAILLRKKEPLDNLGPIETIKTMTETKEEIGDKLIQLDKLKQEAISETEKNQIQDKINYYMRIYQESKLKGSRKNA